ncbi:MAG: hypothetical protein EBQ92_07025 [Proteobacteria bacterium]|nr:hypothetical protein [Pseudomonadota bacterium]
MKTRWIPTWSLGTLSVRLSGDINYRSHQAKVELGIPLALVWNQPAPILVDLSGIDENLKWNAKGVVKSIESGWEGQSQATISHPEWGEFSPTLTFTWGEASDLLISLAPDQIKSNFIKTETNTLLKVVQAKDFFEGTLQGEKLHFVKYGIRLGQLLIHAKNKDSSQLVISGSADSVEIQEESLPHLKNISFSTGFGGHLGLDNPSDLTLTGEIKDGLKSLVIPFTVKGTPNHWSLSSKIKCDLFEGSLAELLAKNQIPGLRLLSGQIVGTLNNGLLKFEVQPTSLLVKDYLITGLTAKGAWDQKKELIGFNKTLFAFADGSVGIQPFDYSLKGKTTELSFSAEGIQLKRILDTLSTKKLSGQGLFQGKGKLVLGSQDFFLSSLELENSAPGTISYLDPTQPFYEKKVVFLNDFEALLAQGQQALVLKALENFHYSHFQIQASRPTTDQVKLLLNLKGKNPDLAKGQLFDITLPIEGNLDSLFKGSLMQQPLTEELNKLLIELE